MEISYLHFFNSLRVVISNHVTKLCTGERPQEILIPHYFDYSNNFNTELPTSFVPQQRGTATFLRKTGYKDINTS